MDCPDGSLCRITSSVKEVSIPVLVVKVPDEELSNFNNFPYKLISVGSNTEECEPSLSEKSDDEDEETKQLELELNIFEKGGKTSDKIIETDNNIVKESSSDSTHKKQNFRESKGSKYFRSNHRQRSYNTSQRGRAYNGPSSGGNYQNSLNASSSTIDPWLPVPMQGAFQFTNYSSFVNPIDSHISTNTSNEIKSAPVGLLGDSPFTPMHQFQSPNQGNLYVPKQTYWENEYHHRSCLPEGSNSFQRTIPPSNSSNYQRSISSNIPVPGRQNHRKNKKKTWKNKHGKNFPTWKNNKSDKVREDNSSGYYNYSYRN